MEFDYSKLRGKIREICGTQEQFGKQMGISKPVISNKLNNKSEFTQPEIIRAMDVLGLHDDEITQYFFTPVVQKAEQKGD